MILGLDCFGGAIMRRNSRRAYEEMFLMIVWFIFLGFTFIMHVLGYSMEVIGIGFLIIFPSFLVTTVILRTKSSNQARIKKSS